MTNQKTGSRKLTLNRETLITLQDNELDGVHGGNFTQIVTDSSNGCIQAGSAIVVGTINATVKIWEVTRQPKSDTKPKTRR